MRKWPAISALLLTTVVATARWMAGCQAPAADTALAQQQLGHYLFFDTRLSFNHTKSCASCHDPKFAFTDGYRRSITATGDNVLHNAPSLINVGLHRYFDWADTAITHLAQQHRRPLFNTQPVELGAKGQEGTILALLQKDTVYQQLFARAFPQQPQPFHFNHVLSALAAYTGSLQSAQSPFDRYQRGDSLAINESARQGWQLFTSTRLQCIRCHGGPHLTNATLTTNTDSIYFNTGLYNVGNGNRYPANDNGLRTLTGKPQDDGRFKVPSLRNVALTAPYLHDGSVASLTEVIELYARGGRLIGAGPLTGDGAQHKHKSPLVTGFSLNEAEKKQLLAFLHALTDSSIFTNPAFQNPFAQANNQLYR
jgi:cytochrome c peroxidase